MFVRNVPSSFVLFSLKILELPHQPRCTHSKCANNVQHLTNRFSVAVSLFSNRSQTTSKCGQNKKVTHEAQPSVSLMFLPHFDALCDLVLNRCTATWNLFVLYNKKLKSMEKMPFYLKFHHFDRHENSTDVV